MSAKPGTCRRSGRERARRHGRPLAEVGARQLSVAPAAEGCHRRRRLADRRAMRVQRSRPGPRRCQHDHRPRRLEKGPADRHSRLDSCADRQPDATSGPPSLALPASTMALRAGAGDAGRTRHQVRANAQQTAGLERNNPQTPLAAGAEVLQAAAPTARSQSLERDFSSVLVKRRTASASWRRRSSLALHLGR